MATPAVKATVTERVWTDLEEKLSPGGGPAPISVLFATDGSKAAGGALEFLHQLPLPPGSEIQVLTVAEGIEWSPSWYLDAANAWSRRIVDRAEEELKRTGVITRTATRFGARAHEILAAAEEFQVDLLVVGSQGHSALEAFLVGSVTQNVARHARCSVLVARQPIQPLRNVLLAIDGSEHSDEGVRFISRFPLPEEAEVTVVHVTTPLYVMPPVYSSDLAVFEQALAEGKKQIHDAGEKLAAQTCQRLTAAGMRATSVVPEGDPATEILKIAEERRADLIISGARGVSLVQGLLMGSVADRLLKSSHCSLLLVR